MKKKFWAIVFIFFLKGLFGQAIKDKYQIISFEKDSYEISSNGKSFLDTLSINFEDNKKLYDFKVKIKKVVLTSLICEEEKHTKNLSKKRCKSVKDYMIKNFKTPVSEFECVFRNDYFPQCKSYDHGVRINIIIDKE